MKMKWHNSKHSKWNGLMIASGLALVMAGTWMGMKMMAHRHSRYMEEEQESC